MTPVPPPSTRQAQKERLRRQREAAERARKRQELDGCSGCVAALVVLVGFLTFFSALIYVGWNLGIAPAFDAKHISFFWDAIGLGFVVLVLRGIVAAGRKA